MTSCPAQRAWWSHSLWLWTRCCGMAPQRDPRSDDTPMIKCLFLSSGSLELSLLVIELNNKVYERNNITILSQDVLNEYQNICALNFVDHMLHTHSTGAIDRAGFRALSALEYFAAATIFMDLVIFWMFLMDFNRMVTDERGKKTMVRNFIQLSVRYHNITVKHILARYK